MAADDMSGPGETDGKAASDNILWLDFNDAPDQYDWETVDLRAQRDEIKARLLANPLPFLRWVFPNGVVKGRKFYVGNLQGDRGRSLEVELEGEKAGVFIDRATNESGDIFHILAHHEQLDVKRDFRKVLAAARAGRRSVFWSCRRATGVSTSRSVPSCGGWVSGCMGALITAMAEWTVDIVAERFAEAAETARRLPPVRVQGYFNLWPAFARREWEAFAAEEYEYRPLPPTPAAIERMLETMGWVQWLDMEQRHLVWMRARQCEWGRIGKRFGCDRNTARRQWRAAIERVVERLNSPMGTRMADCDTK